ncbi:MAG: DUF1987 domain-containing protein [Alcaligenaceae bacterium]|nr:MAG: DUF1987 domain-containing protein [Alcaligenaceae bacterium]
MENLFIAATHSSPEVDFKFDCHSLSLRGESYPENAASFYGEVLRRLREYLSRHDGTRIEVHIALAYFNSSSTKMLFNVIESLNTAAKAGTAVALSWYHDEEDDTILEFGTELSEDFTAIEFRCCPVRAG